MRKTVMEETRLFTQRDNDTEMTKLLLEKGADVNAQGGRYGNILQAASAQGHEAVVKLLDQLAVQSV